MNSEQRLSKVLARCGVASRRACETLILAGRVRVNGAVARDLGCRVDPEGDTIAFDRQTIQAAPSQYFALHKPIGYICSTTGSRTAVGLLDEVPHRLFTVGRLDVKTSGLLLLTNDGAFAHRMLHPSHGVVREYLVKTALDITSEQLCALTAGADIEGEWVTPLKVQKVRRGTLKISIGEGKNREIRRLMQACAIPVAELTRIRIGNLTLGNLPVGAWRTLSSDEREAAVAPHRALLAKTPARRGTR